jgi:hypothetical protein
MNDPTGFGRTIARPVSENGKPSPTDAAKQRQATSRPLANKMFAIQKNAKRNGRSSDQGI